MEAGEEVSGKKGYEWKEKGDAAIAKHRAGEERHGADGREIPWMRHNAQHGGENDHYSGENGAKYENMSGRFFLEHDSSQTSLRAFPGNRSQKTKESRRTTSPRVKSTGREKMGPSKTKVWNSPFSPQGSTPGGRSAKKDSSSSRPAKVGSRTFESMQMATERNCAAWNSRMSSRVSRFQMGKRACISTRARFFSR